MTRRGSRSNSTSSHGGGRVTTVTTPLYDDPEKERDFLLRRHQMLRRAAGFMLAKKYRSSWYSGSSPDSLFSKTLRVSAPLPPTSTRRSTKEKVPATRPTSKSMSCATSSTKARDFTREELINYWKDLLPVAKRALLRIHRDVYLTALDQYLVKQNLCCECHDNVLAEWEDLERRRSSSRSLQDVFSVFPPFLDDDDDDDDEDDEEDDEDEEDEEDDEEDDECEDDHGGERCRHHSHLHDEYDDDLLDGDDGLIDDEDDEEVVFKYELEAEEEFRRARALAHHSHHSISSGGLLSDEYLAALEVGKRQEDELLRLIQKEERYIVIREDHSEFIMDLIRCGEQFSSYMAALRPPSSYDSALHNYGDDDHYDDDAECPGANTSHLAQEYLLEVLAIKFREQLESAYQAALQHSLAVQAELLREEIAELQRDQQPSTSSSKNRKKKDKKKKKKKASESASVATTTSKATNNQSSKAESATRNLDNQTASSSATPDTSPSKPATNSRRGRSNSTPVLSTKKARSNQRDDLADEIETSDHDELDAEHMEAVDREVEEFRQLLEKINAQHKQSKSKPKLLLPPGAFRTMMT